MRQFEQEIGGGRPNFNVPGGPHPNFGIRPNFSGPGGFARPAFMPSSVMRSSLPIRGQAIPPPPSYARPEVVHHPTDRPGVTPLSKAPVLPKKAYAAAPVISKPKPDDDDDDIMATLMKYEKEAKTEKKEKKRKPDEGKQGGPTEKALKPSHPAPAPAKPTVKPGTQVTPDEIKLKAKQMVEMVKANQVIQQKRLAQNQAASSSTTTTTTTKGDKPGKKPKKMIRMAGGQMWEDSSLLNWDQSDYRLFCGDLGNDVTEEVLNRTFNKYPSFIQAKVVRDKRSNKTKGYGFVSFRDPADFTKAIKEVDGKYVGSRPIKLRKSNWKDRNVEQVKTKQNHKNKMGFKH